MSRPPNSIRSTRTGRYLFIAAGCTFVVTAFFGGQFAFSDIAAALIAIGASRMA
ncbi:MAG: hypothetical protein KGO02_08010 [Alphaproteobacteria bacterium]|nr:hypothetical protein [Alphaproteobacteria bacterium]